MHLRVHVRQSRAREARLELGEALRRRRRTRRAVPASASARRAAASCRRRPRRSRRPCRCAAARPGSRRAGCLRPAPRARRRRATDAGRATGRPATRMPSGEYGVGVAASPSRASAASASSRVVFSAIDAQVERRAASPGTRERRARRARRTLAEALPQPVGKVGATAAGSASCRRDLKAREPASSAAVSAASSSRTDRPARARATASASRRGSAVSASASSERIRRRYANTPSATNARSSCPICGCARKNWRSRMSAGASSGDARDAGSPSRRAPRSDVPAAARASAGCGGDRALHQARPPRVSSTRIASSTTSTVPRTVLETRILTGR